MRESTPAPSEQAGPGQPCTLSVCMPVYNERDTIEQVVEKVLGVDVPIELQLVITDDSSTDGSSEVLEQIAKRYPGRILLERHEMNLGKGAAVSSCLRRAEGDVVLIQDADLEYDPNDYPRLIAPILSGQADVVYGSRFLQGRPPSAAKLLYAANKMLTYAFNLVHGTRLTDMETCYKVFRKEAVSSVQIRSKRFGIEPEISAKVTRKGYRIFEIPISYEARTYEEGKKIHAWDGIKALAAILWFRFFC